MNVNTSVNGQAPGKDIVCLAEESGFAKGWQCARQVTFELRAGRKCDLGHGRMFQTEGKMQAK